MYALVFVDSSVSDCYNHSHDSLQNPLTNPPTPSPLMRFQRVNEIKEVMNTIYRIEQVAEQEAPAEVETGSPRKKQKLASGWGKVDVYSTRASSYRIARHCTSKSLQSSRCR